MNNLLKVTHIITDLDVGGAETALYRFVAQSQGVDLENNVVSLKSPGLIAGKLEIEGVAVETLNLQAKSFNPLSVLELAAKLKSVKPDIIQTWMYHADFIGGISARLAGRIPVVWGIRNSTLDLRFSSPETRRLVQINARLATWLPAAIVSNSKTARTVHVSYGYPLKKFKVIPNGFDLDEFSPKSCARYSLRRELHISPRAKVVGLIARFDPQKDHDMFIEAAEIVTTWNENVHYVLAGKGIDSGNSKLLAEISRKPKLAGKFHLIGLRNDIPRLMSGLDVLVSCSAYGESFPNVVGEAMACGVPCVVTDVGDSADIVGSTGLVIPARDFNALAIAIKEIIAWPANKRKMAGKAARNRIQHLYTLEKMIQEYHKLYRSVLNANLQ